MALSSNIPGHVLLPLHRLCSFPTKQSGWLSLPGAEQSIYCAETLALRMAVMITQGDISIASDCLNAIN